MNPENVSTITGDTAKRKDEKKPASRLLDALNPKRPIIKVLSEKEMILIHLAVERKFPLTVVNILKVKGKNGGNSVTGVIVPLELIITAPFPT